MNHIHYASRTKQQFRYEGDKTEVKLEMSIEAAQALLNVVNASNAQSESLLELREVLTDIVNDNLIGFA